MNNSFNIRKRLRLHDRDVVLMDRLFAEWNRGRSQRSARIDARLDTIEAQLARLEQTVTMASSSLCKPQQATHDIAS